MTRAECITCDRYYVEEDPFYEGQECWRCRCQTQQRGNVQTLASAARREPTTRRKITP